MHTWKNIYTNDQTIFGHLYANTHNAGREYIVLIRPKRARMLPSNELHGPQHRTRTSSWLCQTKNASGISIEKYIWCNSDEGSKERHDIHHTHSNFRTAHMFAIATM